MSRIIAGSARGRRLATPKGDRTRPTTDRVREALFSALASWFGTSELPADEQLSGLAVLDLFGGSGAVGLEAASRGAARVTIVEADPATVQLIRRNAAEARLAAQVICARLPGGLAKVSGGWDLVFADPPYDLPDATVAEVLAGVAAAGFLTVDALVVVERAKRSPAPAWPAGFSDSWERGYGETTLHFGTNQVPDEEAG